VKERADCRIPKEGEEVEIKQPFDMLKKRIRKKNKSVKVAAEVRKEKEIM